MKVKFEIGAVVQFEVNEWNSVVGTVKNYWTVKNSNGDNETNYIIEGVDGIEYEAFESELKSLDCSEKRIEENPFAVTNEIIEYCLQMSKNPDINPQDKIIATKIIHNALNQVKKYLERLPYERKN